MYKNFDRFSFCPDNYKERREPYGPEEVNEYLMNEDFATFIRIALKNGYQCRVFSDGYCLICDYNYREPELAGATLEWVGEDEYIGSYAEDAMYDQKNEEDVSTEHV